MQPLTCTGAVTPPVPVLPPGCAEPAPVSAGSVSGSEVTSPLPRSTESRLRPVDRATWFEAGPAGCGSAPMRRSSWIECPGQDSWPAVESTATGTSPAAVMAGSDISARPSMLFWSVSSNAAPAVSGLS